MYRFPSRQTRIGWIVAILLGGTIVSMPNVLRGEEAREFDHVVLIEFRGPIHTLSEQYLYRKLDEAQRREADLIIIEIESPGGEIESTMRIAERLRDLPWARTVAFIPREALSGAALFSLGCDEIIIGPAAVFGDAGPIFMGEDFLFKHAPEKIRTDLVARVRELAESQNRPPALAEAMVDMDLIVYRVKSRETGQTRFMSQDEIDSSDKPDEWEKIKPVFESRESKFLEVSGKRAVELQLANGLASDRDELAQRFPRREDWIELQWNNIDWAVLILNHPIVTALLFVVAMIALYIEFASPGIGVGGLTAVICFSLFFWSRFLGGTAEWLEVILFLSGLALIVVEIFVIPGFGVWGISGLLLLATSLVLASEPFLVPKTQHDLSSLTRTLATVLGSGLVCLVLAAWLTSRIGKIPVLNRLALVPPDSNSSAPLDLSPSGEDVEGDVVQIGQHGIAESPLRPAGKIQIGDHYVDVVSDGTFIEVGETVRVVAVRGNHVVVRRSV